MSSDRFSVSLAVHSSDGVSYDWLDGALFFQVVSPVLVEGIANLNATATARRVGTRNADFGLRIQEQESDAITLSTNPQSAIRNPK